MLDVLCQFVMGGVPGGLIDTLSTVWAKDWIELRVEMGVTEVTARPRDEGKYKYWRHSTENEGGGGR